MIKIKNLTPHTITLCGVNYPSEGCARVHSSKEVVGNIDGIPVNMVNYGEIYGLPEPEKDTIYIVSAIVAQRANRDDCYIVDETVRDEQGRIIGCTALARV